MSNWSQRNIAVTARSLSGRYRLSVTSLLPGTALLRPVALFVRNPAISVSVTAAIAQDHGPREEEACRLRATAATTHIPNSVNAKTALKHLCLAVAHNLRAYDPARQCLPPGPPEYIRQEGAEKLVPRVSTRLGTSLCIIQSFLNR